MCGHLGTIEGTQGSGDKLVLCFLQGSGFGVLGGEEASIFVPYNP